MMRFVPRTTTEWQIAIEHLPDDMPVEIAPGVGVVAINVAALRQVDRLPADTILGIPASRLATSVVKLDKLGESLV